MNKVFTILGRLTMMLIGFAAASFAASALLNLLWLAPLGLDAGAAPIFDGPFLFTVPLMALFISYFAFFPTVVALIIAEWRSARDWLFYTIAGAVVTLPVLGVLLTARAESSLREPGFLLTLVAAGMVGGWFYWLVAGRTAGLWRVGAAAPGRHADASSPRS